MRRSLRQATWQPFHRAAETETLLTAHGGVRPAWRVFRANSVSGTARGEKGARGRIEGRQTPLTLFSDLASKRLVSSLSDASTDHGHRFLPPTFVDQPSHLQGYVRGRPQANHLASRLMRDRRFSRWPCRPRFGEALHYPCNFVRRSYSPHHWNHSRSLPSTPSRNPTDQERRPQGPPGTPPRLLMSTASWPVSRCNQPLPTCKRSQYMLFQPAFCS